MRTTFVVVEPESTPRKQGEPSSTERSMCPTDALAFTCCHSWNSFSPLKRGESAPGRVRRPVVALHAVNQFSECRLHDGFAGCHGCPEGREQL
jgi:hypothetical protein